MADEFRCELHMHSHYSDGSASPERLLQHAAGMGLAVVAITDHDNARGARIAVPLAGQYGIEVIPAIEFTSRWDDPCGTGKSLDVDVLGYFIDLDDPGLQAREQAALADTQARLAECCARLTGMGYPVTMEEALMENPHFAGLRHLRDLLVKKGSAIGYWRAARIVNPVWDSGRLCQFTLAEQVAAIHAAGGVAILAHPTYLCDGELLGASHVAALVEMGVDGLEVYHRVVEPEARVHFQALADRFGLLVTGGSDEHGWSPELPLMGQEPVTRAMVEALRAKSVAVRAKKS